MRRTGSYTTTRNGRLMSSLSPGVVVALAALRWAAALRWRTGEDWCWGEEMRRRKHRGDAALFPQLLGVRAFLLSRPIAMSHQYPCVHPPPTPTPPARPRALGWPTARPPLPPFHP